MTTVYYSQEDPRWRGIVYSNHGDQSQTIGTSGCGPTSVAMAVSSLTKEVVLPTVAATFAVMKGYRTFNNGTSWTYFKAFAEQYGLSCIQTSNLDTIKVALAEGSLIVASMRSGHFTSGGHYILLVEAEGDTISVYDPNQDNRKYGNDGLIDQGVRDDGKVKAKESVIRKEAGQYWIISKIREEDLPMTAAEKKAFEELQTTVKNQAERIVELEKVVAAPNWFVKEFGSADLDGKITEPKLTGEGWRVLAISLRAHK